MNGAHPVDGHARKDRQGEYFAIVPGSGTGELVGITGTGGIAVEPDGKHRIWFDYDSVQ